MARSIHTTRRDLEHAEKDEYSRDEERDAALTRQRERLAQKRRIKRYVQDERRQQPAGVTPVATIPVVVTETGEFVHHMASVDDVQAVLRRLPPGVVDGLTRVELQLGAKEQEDIERRDPGSARPDPFVGRLGCEAYAGVFQGVVFGSYWHDTSVIRINAYVFHPQTPFREVWEPLLRLDALATLVHEVGHHFDFTMRVARGRWLAHGTERIERYAENREHLWRHAVIVPYLRERYPSEISALEAWIEIHGGVALKLESLVDDPRSTGKSGKVKSGLIYFPMWRAVNRLIEDVVANTPAQTRYLGFAHELHYRDLYDEALTVLEIVLDEGPVHDEALTLRADIYVHVRRHAEALEIAQSVVNRAPDNRDAWKVVADACEALERWTDLRAAANSLLSFPARYTGCHFWPRVQRMRAALKLGDLESAREDLATLETNAPSYRQKLLKKLRAELEAALVATTAHQV